MLLGATLVADAAPIFEFAKFFHGKWLLEIRTDTPGATKSADVQLANYHMRMQDGAGSLKGIYFENVTDSESDIRNQLRVNVELTTPSAGVFKQAKAHMNVLGAEDDEEDLKWKTLFDFDFETHASGVRVSTGEWHGKRKGMYQFTITSPTTWILTIMPTSAADGETVAIQTISAQRAEKPSLFEKHGTTALVFIVFLAFKFGQIYIKNKGAQRRAIQAAQRAAAASAPKNGKAQ